MTEVQRYQRLRAPEGNGEVLCAPAWSDLTATLGAAKQLDGTLFGRHFTEVRQEARQAVVARARKFTEQYADVSQECVESGPLILTGHQPEFFHPGVWLKNFAAAELAHRTQGTAVNLIIDSDLCRTASIRVPTGKVDNPRVTNVAFDRSLPQVPFEERPIDDLETWKSFGNRVVETLHSLIPDPLIAEWWPEVVRQSTEGQLLGESIAQARHQLELKWHHPSWEIPQSEVCESEPFRLFALHVLTRADRFRSAYNAALADYRQAHKLQNHAQPVPDLGQQDDWIEVPFWMWTSADPVRRGPFVRRTSQGIEMTDRKSFREVLPINEDGDPGTAIHLLEKWGRQGVKLRTRALLTTMFARLFVADLFIHGIGGAKYDEVTDELCREFFGFSPPQYATLSGTLRLPIQHAKVDPQRVVKLKSELREIEFHPERVLHASPRPLANQSDVVRLIDQKRELVSQPETPQNASERHSEIVALNQQLRGYLTDYRKSREQELIGFSERLRVNRLLESRDYPFCLFPPGNLNDFLLDFSGSFA